jgi:hypothetical protein
MHAVLYGSYPETVIAIESLDLCTGFICSSCMRFGLGKVEAMLNGEEMSDWAAVNFSMLSCNTGIHVQFHPRGKCWQNGGITVTVLSLEFFS